MLRADTGEEGNCRQVSDTIVCGSYGLLCDSGTPCRDVAEERISYYMDALGYVKSTYEWYIGVSDENDMVLLEMGNADLPDRRTKKWSASQTVYRKIGYNDHTFVVRVILAKPMSS